MNEFEKLKKKWSEVHQTKEVKNFDYALLEKGKFCIHMTDSDASGPCSSSVEATGFFDGAVLDNRATTDTIGAEYVAKTPCFRNDAICF